MQLTTNFNLSEFRCNDGTDVPESLVHNVKELAENLQVLRDEVKSPIHINSGYRTTTYNHAIGGVGHSQHLLGKASDIVINGKTPKEVAAIIEKLIAAGKMKQGGIGTYATFVHYDIRGTKARWYSA